MTAQNLYAVLLGDRKAVKGGSGKVVNSKANDRIFIFYSDHGGPGVLGIFFFFLYLVLYVVLYCVILHYSKWRDISFNMVSW